MAEEVGFKNGDRVRRKNRPGCAGTIKDVRTEVIGSSGEARDRGLLIEVKWDNGTVSIFAPEGLEIA